jgi:hypothetical protein
VHRLRLTFDANPKELARRDSAGSHVALLWSRRTGRAAVVVEDATGEVVELDVRERDNPLELYEHAYVFLRARGHPGWHPATTLRPVALPQPEIRRGGEYGG